MCPGQTVHPQAQPLRRPTASQPAGAPDNWDVKFQPYFFGTTKSANRGFTLIELLVSLSVLAILMGLAVPSFRATIAANQLTSRTNELVSALNMARSEAIRRGSRVTLCKSSTGTSCSSTGDWEQGWVVFVDTTRSGTTASIDSGETVLLVQQAVSGSTLIKGNPALDSYVSFGADGRPRTVAGNSTSGKLLACNTSTSLTDSSRARQMELSSVGRLSTSTPTSVASTCPAPTT